MIATLWTNPVRSWGALALVVALGSSCLCCAECQRVDEGGRGYPRVVGALVPLSVWRPDKRAQVASLPGQGISLSVVFREADGDAVVWTKRPGEVYWDHLQALLSDHSRRALADPVYVVSEASLAWSDLWRVLRVTGAAMALASDDLRLRDRTSGLGNDVILVTAGWGSGEEVSGVGFRSWLYPHRRVRLSEPIVRLASCDSSGILCAELRQVRESGEDRLLGIQWARSSEKRVGQHSSGEGSVESCEFVFFGLLVPAFGIE